MIPSAYLRVFRPLDVLTEPERVHWERDLVRHRAGSSPRPRYADRPTSGGLGFLVPNDGEHADVRVVDGRTFVSPHRTRMRVLASVLAFREAQAVELWDRFVPKREGRRAARELARIRRRDPSAVACMHQSRWQVPVRWFLLFTDDERVLDEDERGRRRLRYRTSVRKAIRRAEQAVPVLRNSDLGPIAELIVDLHQWLVQFESQSLVELDYGSLCDDLTWDELDDDHSALEVNAALDALFKGDYAAAAEMYQGAIARWAEVRSREIWN